MWDRLAVPSWGLILGRVLVVLTPGLERDAQTLRYPRRPKHSQRFLLLGPQEPLEEMSTRWSVGHRQRPGRGGGRLFLLNAGVRAGPPPCIPFFPHQSPVLTRQGSSRLPALGFLPSHVKLGYCAFTLMTPTSHLNCFKPTND